MTDKQQSVELLSCSLKPPIDKRNLITQEQAADLTVLFKILANDTRLRILHALIKGGEVCVSDIAREVEMKPQAISNQLQKLVGAGIVNHKRNGNQIYYRIIDPCVVNLLDRGLCLSEDSKNRIK